ncbi:MAG: retroviral-like aspartic protease family protein [Chloroflexi bacterium]|nr:retroviral-like aspartic protease family protein [Chloroflexota bacterium]
MSTPAENLHIGPLRALIDTGADATIVPLNHLETVSALETITMSVRGQWGESRSVMLYIVDLRIGDISLPQVEVVGDDLSDEIVLGRGVLNLLRIFLDGPGETIEITE